MTKFVVLVIWLVILARVSVLFVEQMWAGMPRMTKRVHLLLALILWPLIMIISRAGAISMERAAPWSAEVVGPVWMKMLPLGEHRAERNWRPSAVIFF